MRKYCPDPDHCNYSDCPTAFCVAKEPLVPAPCSAYERLKAIRSSLAKLRNEVEDLARDNAHQQMMTSIAGGIQCSIPLTSSVMKMVEPNVEVCDGGRKTSELKQDANRHSQH